MSKKVRVGTAGSALPAPARDVIPVAPSNLARYADCFDAVEINSCSTAHGAGRKRPRRPSLCRLLENLMQYGNRQP